jgi:hypothetical protein
MTSQAAGIKRRFAFSRGLAQKSFQFRARLRIVKQLFPTLIVDSRELAQLVEYRASFGVAELWQLFDDLRCAHGAIIIWSRRFVSAEVAKLSRVPRNGTADYTDETDLDCRKREPFIAGRR